MYSSVVLYSGGIDSFILLDYVRKCIDPNTQPVYFDIHSNYSEVEKEFIKKSEPDCIIDESVSLGDMETDTAFIPNRNIILTTLAVSRYAKSIFIGGSKSDRIFDNNRECFDILSDFLTKIDGMEVVKITSPFWDVYKVDMIRWWANSNHGDELDIMTNTFSCYTPLETPQTVDIKVEFDTMQLTTNQCLACPACFRKNAALSYLKGYIPFYNDKIIEQYKNEFEAKNHLDLTDSRLNNTLQYIDYIERSKDNNID
jgi:7-cyano-7-deazaguanine synthase in queuosine biosynthesis